MVEVEKERNSEGEMENVWNGEEDMIRFNLTGLMHRWWTKRKNICARFVNLTSRGERGPRFVLILFYRWPIGVKLV